MTVFKTYLKVLNKCKVPIIIYTVFLLFFAGFNFKNNDNNQGSFEASKPDVLVINQDKEEGITKHLMEYIASFSNPVSIKDSEYAINDALFYRDVNYIISIPEGFRDSFLNGVMNSIEVKSTGDYQASLAEMKLKRYLQVLSFYQNIYSDEEVILSKTEKILQEEVKVEVTTSLDTDSLGQASTYYNFTNYCLLAGSIYVICLVIASFKSEGVEKRTIVSSMDYKILNRKLLLANSLFAFALWFFYAVLSFLLIGDVIFSIHGLFYLLNSFVFTFCTLTIAFLLGNLVHNKEAVNGIVNVIALGSSFLCGAFVPMEMLPDSVLTFAHVLPSYWFIQTNETLKTLEVFSKESVVPIFINMGIILLFSFVFIILTNIVSYKKRKIA